jgi:hypothetical protein
MIIGALNIIGFKTFTIKTTSCTQRKDSHALQVFFDITCGESRAITELV